MREIRVVLWISLAFSLFGMIAWLMFTAAPEPYLDPMRL